MFHAKYRSLRQFTFKDVRCCFCFLFSFHSNMIPALEQVLEQLYYSFMQGTALPSLVKSGQVVKE